MSTNGGNASIEAIAKSVLLTAISRIMIPAGMTAVLGISGWAAMALWQLNSGIAGHTATLAAIEQRLDRIDGSSGATAVAAAALQSDVAYLKEADRQRGAEIQAVQQQLITLRRNIQNVTCRVMPSKCESEP